MRAVFAQTSGKTAAAGALVAVATALALAFPPEVHAESGAAVAGLLAVAALLVRSATQAGPVLVAFGGVAFALAASFAPGRSLETCAALALPAAAFVVARAVDARGRARALGGIAAVGATLGLFAVAQKVWLLPAWAAQARADGAPVDAILRYAQGRPFVPFSVPAALAGALVLALAASLSLALRADDEGGSRGVRRAALAACVPTLAGLVTTGSIGALAGIAAASLVAGRPLFRRLPERARWAAAVFGIVLVAAVVLARPMGDLGAGSADNPLRLRAGNWRGALLAAVQAPFAGIGPGAFASLYPAVRRAGDIETIYAHNAWLQFAVEGGLPALALLAAGAFVLWRRVRRGGGVDALAHAGQDAALAGVCAFVVQNLADFTLYLPGVSLPAAVVAAVAFARPEPAHGALPASAHESLPEPAQDPLRDPAHGPVPRKNAAAVPAPRAGAVLLAVALLFAAAVFGGAALATRSIESDEQNGKASSERRTDPPSAPRYAPWSTTLGLRAGGLMLAEQDFAPAADLASRLAALDPEHPGPRRLAAQAAEGLRDPFESWRAWAAARARHPASVELAERAKALEDEMKRAGLWNAPLAYGGATVRALEFDWEVWDLLLLLVQLVLAAFVVSRWRSPGAAPAAGLAIVFALLVSAWGDGGALPGVRLGRQVLVAVALLAALWPREQAVSSEPRAVRPVLPRGLLLALAAVLGWAALSTVFAPDRASARGGLCALAAAAAVGLIASIVSRDNDAWPEVVLGVFAASAALAGLLFLVQKAATLVGVDLSQAEIPLRAAGGRPAADFLHPGHLGTYLVAAGLAVGGAALSRERKTPLALVAAAFVLAGLSGGARASLLALTAGGVVLALAAGDARTRRIVAGLCGAALLAGAGAVAWRFAGGDAYAFSRLGIWRAALQSIADRPLLGSGPGAFGVLAPSYAFPDAFGAARFGKSFVTPHSDLLAVFVGLGLPGGLLLLGFLALVAGRIVRAVRESPDRGPAAGLAAALAAFVAHGFVDDLAGERPAVAIAVAVIAGTLAGRALQGGAEIVEGLAGSSRGASRGGLGALDPAGSGGPGGATPAVQDFRTTLWEPSLGARIAWSVAVITALCAGEVVPWVADMAYRAGHPLLAARLDGATPGYWLASARGAGGEDPARRLALALDRIGRARQAAPLAAAPREEEALALEAACRGPLPVRPVCERAIAAWTSVTEIRRASAPALYRRGLLRAHVGDLDGGASDLASAVVAEPSYLAARLDYARALEALGRPGEARTERLEAARRARELEGHRANSVYEATLLALTPGQTDVLRRLLAGSAAPADEAPAASSPAPPPASSPAPSSGPSSAPSPAPSPAPPPAPPPADDPSGAPTGAR